MLRLGAPFAPVPFSPVLERAYIPDASRIVAGVQRLLDGLPVVYLAADFRTVARRTGLDVARVVVPGNPRGRLRAMLEERRPLYERLASIIVQTDDKDPEELAAELAAMIGPPR